MTLSALLFSPSSSSSLASQTVGERRSDPAQRPAEESGVPSFQDELRSADRNTPAAVDRRRREPTASPSADRTEAKEGPVSAKEGPDQAKADRIRPTDDAETPAAEGEDDVKAAEDAALRRAEAAAAAETVVPSAAAAATPVATSSNSPTRVGTQPAAPSVFPAISSTPTNAFAPAVERATDAAAPQQPVGVAQVVAPDAETDAPAAESGPTAAVPASQNSGIATSATTANRRTAAATSDVAVTTGRTAATAAPESASATADALLPTTGEPTSSTSRPTEARGSRSARAEGDVGAASPHPTTPAAPETVAATPIAAPIGDENGDPKATAAPETTVSADAVGRTVERTPTTEPKAGEAPPVATTATDEGVVIAAASTGGGASGDLSDAADRRGSPSAPETAKTGAGAADRLDSSPAAAAFQTTSDVRDAARATDAEPATAPTVDLARTLESLRGEMQAGKREIVLRLDPPELGRLDVRLMQRGDAVVARVTAENPETADFFRRDRAALERFFVEQGVPLLGLDVRSGSFSGRERPDAAPERAEPGAGPTLRPAAAVRAVPRGVRSSTSVLDLYA